MPSPRNLVCRASGLFAAIVYLVMAVASRAMYPAAFGPVGNWLSDLGNNLLNPGGALFYRLGGIVGGSGLAGFFLALDGSSWGEQKAVRALARLVRVFGTLASAAFILTGVFSEDMMPLHSWFSIANFAAFGTAIALSGLAALLGAALPTWFAGICFSAWAFDIASSIFGGTRWLEWVVVAFLIAYVSSYSLMGFRSRRRAPVPAGSA